ncbi:MAG: response regulator transcription factor [Bacteroidota bacterium]
MKNRLKCLIIEDEPIAVEILSDYIAQVDFLALEASFPDALKASSYLREHAVDVLFLDIHLPGIKGLDFLRSWSKPPQTILTTAYHQYALEAFEADAVDYLMKPIAFPRFLKAVQKLDRSKPERLTDQERPYRFINVNKKNIRIYFDEIRYIESLKDYCRIVTTQGAYVTRGHLGLVADWFPGPSFLRIHRSFLINLDAVRAFSANEVDLGLNQSLPIGRSYKGRVQEAVEQWIIT